MARKAPSIIFIDELDSIAARRLNETTGADREVQRTLMQLLAEMDGFDKRKNIRIIAATTDRTSLTLQFSGQAVLTGLSMFPCPVSKPGEKSLKSIAKR